MVALQSARDEDPITRALRPPVDETPEQRDERVREYRAARLVSREIDDAILEDKKELERKRNSIRVLLLGQAESGKSTTLRNFQLQFCPTQFRSERPVWKTVIQLNIIRSVKTILEALATELDAAPTSPPTSPGAPTRSPTRSPRLSLAQPVASGSGSGSGAPAPPAPARLTGAHRQLCRRLSPLLAIEQALTRKLLAIPEFAGVRPGPDGVLQIDTAAAAAAVAQRALTVRAGSGWKRILQVATRGPARTPSPPPAADAETGSQQGTLRGRPPPAADRSRDDPTGALVACRQDIVSLWSDPVLRAVLRERGVRPENASGFFLDDVERIAAHGYEPTSDDILRARIRTLGVEEHHFAVESVSTLGGALGGDKPKDWYIYDVGGSRSMRERWPPFFDDVDAIIFLAPLVFDQFLEEAPTVNRVKDSLQLWQQVCGNKLLHRTAIILFLNKTDVLARTLADGVQLKDFIPRYDKPNDMKHVMKYFIELFTDYHQRLSPKSRPFYWHQTSVIDAKSTCKILGDVQESILRVNLSRVNII